jgi:hypothetical protein
MDAQPTLEKKPGLVSLADEEGVKQVFWWSRFFVYGTSSTN